MDRKEYFDTSKIKGQYQTAVADRTAKALTYFCDEESEFEQAIEQSDKSFQECLNEICKGLGKSISDFDFFNKAVKFYFPPAKIHYDMRIDLSGDNGYEAPPITMAENKPAPTEEKKPSGMTISLDDLLDDL